MAEHVDNLDLDREQKHECRCDHVARAKYGRFIDGEWHCLVCRSRAQREQEHAQEQEPVQEAEPVTVGGGS